MINIKNLYLKYIREYFALYDVNLEVSQGEKVALIGEEESGKTSLIRILAKLEKFTSGEIFIKNTPIRKINYARDINVGYIPANPVFFENKTVYENLKWSLKVQKTNKTQIDEKINNVLKDFQLSDIKETKVKFLSLYEKYLLSFARLSFRKIDLALIDGIFERVENKDENKNLQEVVKNMFKNETLILATESEEIANTLCEKKIYFKSGSIIEEL